MALDPSIITGVQPAQVQSPFAAIGQIAQIEDVRAQVEQRRQAAEKARQDAADQAQIRSVFANAGGDVDKGLADLYKVNPRAAATLDEAVGKARKESRDAYGKDLDNRIKTLQFGAGVFDKVTDQTTYDLARPWLAQVAPDLAKQLPETYDKGRVDALIAAGTDAKDRLELHKQALTHLANGDYNKAASTAFSAINPQGPNPAAEWQTTAQALKEQGVPDSVLALYGSYTGPESVRAAATRGITPEKRAELAGQADTRAETALRDQAAQAHQKAEEAISRGNLAVAQGHLAVARAAEARLAAKGEAGRELPAGSATKIAAYNTGLDDLKTLTTTLVQPGATGVGATIGAAVPDWVTSMTGWGTEPKQKEATIGLVKQVIGKTLEGGVLRREDEIKYAKILPKIEDSPAIVASKLQGLDQAIRQQRQRDLEALSAAGYNVSRFTEPPPTAPGTPPPTVTAATGPTVGQVVSVKGQRVRVTKVLPNGKYEGVPVP